MVLVACFVALAVILAASEAAIAQPGSVPTDPAQYHSYLYVTLTSNGGRDFIRDIPGFSSDQFDTYLDAYQYVIGLAAGGYVDDQILWGQEDYWASSRETQSVLLGDCEDWSIYLAALLLYHTKVQVDAWVAVGQLTWPPTIAPGAGGSPTAPPEYNGGHVWVVIPAPPMPGVPADSWLVLDPVYFNVAAAEGIAVPYFDPNYGQTFYVSPNGIYLEAFRFNENTASGFVQSLLPIPEMGGGLVEGVVVGSGSTSLPFIIAGGLTAVLMLIAGGWYARRRRLQTRRYRS